MIGCLTETTTCVVAKPLVSLFDDINIQIEVDLFSLSIFLDAKSKIQ